MTGNYTLRALNPFMPGAGLQPPELAGRMKEIELMDGMVARTKLARLDRGLILYGLRGIGKTVLLLHMKEIADRQHMATFKIEATKNAERAYDALFRGLPLAIARIRKPDLRQRLMNAFSSVESISFEFLGVKTSAERSAASYVTESYKLQLLIERMCEELKKDNLGLYLFIDELQEMASEPLGDLITIQHEMGQENLPFYIIGAGLPDLPGVLAKSRSYAERLFEYRHIGKLSQEDTEDGFQKPAKASGRPFDDASLEKLVNLSKGYPYFIQAYGAAAWNESDSNPIHVDAVTRGIPEALHMLDEGLYISRWQRSTPAGRAYLRCMAEYDEGSISTSLIASSFQKSGTASTARAVLMELGLIYSPEHGKVAFSIPGMGEFIRRVEPAEDQSYDERR